MAVIPLVSPDMPGSPNLRRIERAMLLCGWFPFALLYSVQPLFPQFAVSFHQTPAHSSWTLALTSALLALSIVASLAFAGRADRRRLLSVAMAMAAVANAMAAGAQTFAALLAWRALVGVALGCIPAVVMAYLAAHLRGHELSRAAAVFIGANVLGGMAGRAASAALQDVFGWRMALGLLSVAALAAAWLFWRTLPADDPVRAVADEARTGAHGDKAVLAAHPNQRQAGTVRHASPASAPWWRTLYGDAGLPWLFLIGFLLMGVFVSLYNYLSFHMLARHRGAMLGVLGVVSLINFVGLGSSGWSGGLAARFAHRQVLWVALLLMLGGLALASFDHLALAMVGLAVFTCGFFATNAAAAAWVNLRAASAQAMASATYLFCYYLGSSSIGTLSGQVWAWLGWRGVIGTLALLLMVAFAAAMRLHALHAREQEHGCARARQPPARAA